MDTFKIVHFTRTEPNRDGFNNEYVVILFSEDDIAEHCKPGFEAYQELDIDGDATTFPLASSLAPEF